MVAPITIEGGIEIGGGINIGSDPLPTPGPVLKLSLDAATYSGSGPWVDTVSGKSFTLNNGPTYSTSNGGYFSFDPANAQWANSSTSLPNLSTWTVEAWHYYDGTNVGVAPCIVTETFPGATNNINYNLGCVATSPSNTATTVGFFSGSAWRNTSAYPLTAGLWYYLVGTYDGSEIRAYVNSSNYSTTSYTGTPLSSQGGIRLMSRWDNADYWGGRLAIVKIYEGALSSAGITANWNATKARFGL